MAAESFNCTNENNNLSTLPTQLSIERKRERASKRKTKLRAVNSV